MVCNCHSKKLYSCSEIYARCFISEHQTKVTICIAYSSCINCVLEHYKEFLQKLMIESFFYPSEIMS